MTLQLRARDIRVGDQIEVGEPRSVWIVRRTTHNPPSRTFSEPRTGLLCDELSHGRDVSPWSLRAGCNITRHPDDLIVVKSIGWRNTFRVLYRGLWS